MEEERGREKEWKSAKEVKRKGSLERGEGREEDGVEWRKGREERKM